MQERGRSLIYVETPLSVYPGLVSPAGHLEGDTVLPCFPRRLSDGACAKNDPVAEFLPMMPWNRIKAYLLLPSVPTVCRSPQDSAFAAAKMTKKPQKIFNVLVLYPPFIEV